MVENLRNADLTNKIKETFLCLNHFCKLYFIAIRSRSFANLLSFPEKFSSSTILLDKVRKPVFYSQYMSH